MEAKVAQALGLQHYRQKRYDAALDAFNKAHNLSKGSSVSILDNRAAALEKLGDLKGALRDARRMIHLSKSEPEGYLRTGRVLQIQGKLDVALGLYAYGLRNVPLSHPRRKLLQQIHDNAVKRKRPRQGINPFDVLATELLCMIADQLDFGSLINCLRVCKQWNVFLSSRTPLWRTLDLSCARQTVRWRHLQSCVRRSKGTITKAKICQLAVIDVKIVQHLIRMCKDLEFLEISENFRQQDFIDAATGARNLTTLILRAENILTLRTVKAIMNTCNRLSRAEFFAVRNNGPSGSWDNDLPELRCFRISGVESFIAVGPTDLDLTHFAERAPNLVELAVSYNTWRLTGDMGLALNVKPLAHLESLNLRAVRVWAFPLLAPNIRTLKLNDLRIMQDDGTGEFRVEGADLTDLTTLEFDDYSKLKVSDLRTLLDPSRGKLKILSIAGSNMDQQELEMMAHEGYFANLTNFGAHGTMMQDNFVEALAHNARYLQQVDLSKTAITGIAVKALVVNCPLVSLNLGLCSYISIDAVEWARQKGVNVEFYLQDNLKYSKKTRVGYPLVLNV